METDIVTYKRAVRDHLRRGLKKGKLSAQTRDNLINETRTEELGRAIRDLYAENFTTRAAAETILAGHPFYFSEARGTRLFSTEAILHDPASTGCPEALNYKPEKEQWRGMTLVHCGSTVDRLQYPQALWKEPVTVRWYMGRSKGASRVYCSLWVRTKNHSGWNGRGMAGGYGYDKFGGSFALAAKAAAIELCPAPAGSSCVRDSLKAIGVALGHKLSDLHIVEY